MYMAIIKRGDKLWVDFSVNRTRYRRPSPENTVAGAKAFEAKLRAMLVNGQSLEDDVKQESVKTYIFSEFAEMWMVNYAKSNNKDSEYTNKRSMLNRHLFPFFGKMRLDKISNLDIEKFKSEKVKMNLSNKTINNYLIALNKLFHCALDWEVLTKKPKVKLLKVEPQKFDFLTEDELIQLLDKTTGDIHDMILIAAKTGMRHGELTALNWNDIDLKPGFEQITIQKSVYKGKITSTKSNKIRHVPLTDGVIEMLHKRPTKTGLLFPSQNDTPITPSQTIKKLHRACLGAEIRPIGWHVLRHTFASHLVQNGVALYTVMKLMGHYEVSVTTRYAHLGKQDTKNAVDVLEKKCHKNVTISFFDQNQVGILPSRFNAASQ